MANSKEDTASVTRVSQVTYLSGELTGQQSRSKSFSISGPAGVKVVYSSSAQSGSQAAPVTVYIDGIKVGRTNCNISIV